MLSVHRTSWQQPAIRRYFCLLENVKHLLSAEPALRKMWLHILSVLLTWVLGSLKRLGFLVKAILHNMLIYYWVMARSSESVDSWFSGALLRAKWQGCMFGPKGGAHVRLWVHRDWLIAIKAKLQIIWIEGFLFFPFRSIGRSRGIVFSSTLGSQAAGQAFSRKLCVFLNARLILRGKPDTCILCVWTPAAGNGTTSEQVWDGDWGPSVSPPEEPTASHQVAVGDWAGRLSV